MDQLPERVTFIVKAAEIAALALQKGLAALTLKRRSIEVLLLRASFLTESPELDAVRDATCFPDELYTRVAPTDLLVDMLPLLAQEMFAWTRVREEPEAWNPRLSPPNL